jgi:DNA-binding MarR family transcriptional regulator
MPQRKPTSTRRNKVRVLARLSAPVPAAVQTQPGSRYGSISHHDGAIPRQRERSREPYRLLAEWVILREICAAGETSPGRLATSTGLTRGAVSKLVDRLFRKGLVSRAEADRDRRFQDVTLTGAGRALVPRLAALADRNDEEFLSQLSAREREALVATLRKLVLSTT